MALAKANWLLLPVCSGAGILMFAVIFIVLWARAEKPGRSADGGEEGSTAESD